MFQFDVKVSYRLISGKFSAIKNALYLSVKVFSTKVLIGDTTFTSPTGDGTPFYMVIQATRVQRDYVHFPVILRPQVLFRPRESNPRSSALQSSALPTKLILPREKFFHPSVCLTNQKPRGFASVRETNQIAPFSVRVLFLFCSRVFISRSYETKN